MDIHGLLRELLAGQRLSAERSEALFEALLSGELAEAQIASALSLIQSRGATIDELVGAARVMRRRVTPVPVEDSDAAPIVCTAGTGGAPKTFNVSTASAIVAAAAAPGRIRVAKHGNRSRTGRGSSEVMERLGIDVAAAPEVQAACLDELGVCFCFAIHHHPAARHAAPTRKALGFPTMFNLLGPMTNPAGARCQVMGVYDASLVDLIAQTLARLGARHAIVMHSEDGLDELTVTARTHLARVRDGAVTRETVDPSTLGFERATLDDLRASDLDHAAQIIRDVLAGKPGPCRDMVELSTAATLQVADAAETLEEGVGLAREAIDSGRARETLGRLAERSNRT
jgi:anthranilate phosphoribosyltransferase